MRTIVIFYSYTGKTKEIAHETAKRSKADIVEVRDKARPGILKALLFGTRAAKEGKHCEIELIAADLKMYDKLIVMSPIWAGYIVPAINSLLKIIPKGKRVEFKAVSKRGKSLCKGRVKEIVAARGCKLEDYEDVKAK
ncbi:MAG: hypothetical protein LBU32_07485 [Clostridiales bacterium]|nr:hypothetical protein [Clostridiales bacterium]